MARRRVEEENIRKLTKLGKTSLAVTIPARILSTLGWKKKQKVVVSLRGKKVVTEDWKK
ncbi:MAG: hypothetical protein Q7S38_02030 [bacterium]|nr:hypothetical protein [bacterium]